MSKFDIAFNYVIENEGTEFVDDPSDKGGSTKFGISEKFINGLKNDDDLPTTASSRGTGESHEIGVFSVENAKQCGGLKFYIEFLTIDLAKWIYQKYFWIPIYEQIENQEICNFIFDMTVQHGKSKAAELTQRAINAAYRSRELDVDSKFGNLTLKSVNYYSFKAIQSAHINKLKSPLIAVRESLFRCIVAHDKSQEKFLDGWLSRCYR